MSQYQLPTILVVENEPDPSRRLEVSLDRIGFEGVSVTSGEQALAWLDEEGWPLPLGNWMAYALTAAMM